jgi:hypothetical protein
MQTKQPSRSRYADDDDGKSAAVEGKSTDRINDGDVVDAAMSSALCSRSREYDLLYRRTDHLPAAIDQVLTVFYGPAFVPSYVELEDRPGGDAVIRTLPLPRRWHSRIPWQESLQLLHHILALYTPVSLTSAGSRRQASLPAEVIAEILHRYTADLLRQQALARNMSRFQRLPPRLSEVSLERVEQWVLVHVPLIVQRYSAVQGLSQGPSFPTSRRSTLGPSREGYLQNRLI